MGKSKRSEIEAVIKGTDLDEEQRVDDALPEPSEQNREAVSATPVEGRSKSKMKKPKPKQSDAAPEQQSGRMKSTGKQQQHSSTSSAPKQGSSLSRMFTTTADLASIVRPEQHSTFSFFDEPEASELVPSLSEQPSHSISGTGLPRVDASLTTATPSVARQGVMQTRAVAGSMRQRPRFFLHVDELKGRMEAFVLNHLSCLTLSQSSMFTLVCMN
jgi:hypothetical protein